MRDHRFYHHSGRFSAIGLLLGFIATSLVGSALAVIYAYGIRYIPFVYINVLLTLGFGLVLGLLAGRFVVQFKIRNATLAYAMTFLAVLVSYYLAWVAWIAAHLRGGDMQVSMLRLAQHPRIVWELIKMFNEHGTWSIGRNSSELVSGVFLTIVWIAEAAMIFGAALLVLRTRLKMPFCEACEHWCEERKAVAAVGAEARDSLRQRLTDKDWTSLEEAGPQEPHIGTWCSLDLHTCPHCGQTNTLTLNAVTMTTDRKGESKTATHTLIDRLLLTVDETRSLLATCDHLKACAAAPPVSAAAQAQPASDSGSATP